MDNRVNAPYESEVLKRRQEKKLIQSSMRMSRSNLPKVVTEWLLIAEKPISQVLMHIFYNTDLIILKKSYMLLRQTTKVLLK